jgi:ADP-ribosyl-[dinitrogen reductase] hydrolase
MLLELAVGDAYGAGFEYANEMVANYNDLSGYVQHPRHRRTLPGMYTDDTQMSIAIAEAIVSGEAWTPLNLATRFVAVFKRDPREGYAQGFHDFLVSIEDGQQFLAQIRPDSDKSGAAMRAGAIGVFPTPAEVIKKCTVQAALTHNTPDGIDAACTAALMTHYFLYGHGQKAGLEGWLREQVPGAMWGYPMPDKVKAQGWMSVRAAVAAVMRNDRLSDLLRDCISLRGDVDTVATVALAAASCSGEYAQDLPQHLIDRLENGTCGRDYLIALDARLLAFRHERE